MPEITVDGQRLHYVGAGEGALLAVLGLVGPRPVLGSAMRALFGPAFLADPSRRGEVATWRERIAASDPRGLIRFGRAIFARDGVLDELGRVGIPTLVVAGEQDRAICPSHGRDIAAAIPDARFEIIHGAGHVCTVERPDAVNAVLVPFLREQVGARG